MLPSLVPGEGTLLTRHLSVVRFGRSLKVVVLCDFHVGNGHLMAIFDIFTILDQFRRSIRADLRQVFDSISC